MNKAQFESSESVPNSRTALLCSPNVRWISGVHESLKNTQNHWWINRSRQIRHSSYCLRMFACLFATNWKVWLQCIKKYFSLLMCWCLYILKRDWSVMVELFTCSVICQGQVEDQCKLYCDLLFSQWNLIQHFMAVFWLYFFGGEKSLRTSWTQFTFDIYTFIIFAPNKLEAVGTFPAVKSPSLRLQLHFSLER